MYVQFAAVYMITQHLLHSTDNFFFQLKADAVVTQTCKLQLQLLIYFAKIFFFYVFVFGPVWHARDTGAGFIFFHSPQGLASC